VTQPPDPGAQVRLLQSVMWRSLRGVGLEHCGLWNYPLPDSDQPGWALRGTAVSEFDGVPAEVRYRIIADRSWRTRRVHVGVVRGGERAALRLETDGQGSWRSTDGPLPEFDGCLDVDLGVTASTNTLPIRRVNPPVGDSVELVAAWVRFPDLAMERLPQRYTHLSEDRYRYESLDSDFSAELLVDDLGLVVHYSGWFERVAAFGPQHASPIPSR
jgi:hypothetical protein